ncbi:hypothetical protein CTheo_5475 [Ceratobasidium theobromae]|uniref:DUF2306 domain-containing protein n=1 Tax=Ceratobasidium theobromae TaxID=1582974 RepID=A0A5N5QH62_9AGAM|nr:hypothetical protein CTheo_5475 [Ceratobasidium theobromae]
MQLFNDSAIMGCNLSCIYQSILSVLPPTSNPAPDALHTRVELKTHIPLLIHLSCVVPAFFVAFPLMRVKKGTKAHRVLGTLFMVLMTVGVGITYWIKLLRRKDETRDLVCRLSPWFSPNAFCQFSMFHVGTTITLSHIFLSILALKRRDIKAHKRWTFWVVVSVVVGGPLLPRERLTGMWLRGENPAWQPVDVVEIVKEPVSMFADMVIGA